MNKSREEHLKRLNPTGMKWEEMSEDQQLDLRKKWNEIVSQKKNLACTCPRAYCRNNNNCQFCVTSHRFYGSLPDCLRIVDDKISAEVPYEKRHNVHSSQNRRQKYSINRADYARLVTAWHNANPEQGAALAKRNTASWHRIVRDPEIIKCRCPRTDCWYHGNCTKCLALHTYYDGFPHCCKDIYDGIDAAIQAYKQEAECADDS